ncbi:hypothetical protein ACOSP7_014943 [Xanthoceras sorbifolium]
MTEVIANKEDIEEDEIVFNSLKSLTLTGLSSLTSFCSANYSFKFPSLKEFTVIYCHKMETFSSQVLSTPMLEKVHFQNWGPCTWEGDLNTTIQQIYRRESGAKDCSETSAEDSVRPL